MTEPQIIVTRRTPCARCDGQGFTFNGSIEAQTSDSSASLCEDCKGVGYTDESIDLLTALTDARITEINCGCGLMHWGTVEGDEGQMLVWTCSQTGDLHREVNA